MSPSPFTSTAARDKQVTEITDRLGAAEQQQAAAVERVVKQGQHFLLQTGAEIDQ
jgi:hypothetical protein